MPTAPTHAVAALALGAVFHRPGTPHVLWLAGAVLSAIPDLDVVGFRLGIAYGDLLGHRGLSHSFAFAVILGGLVALLGWRSGAGPLPFRVVWIYLALATASHGLLDMLTDGGLGIALAAPIDETRYFFPVRPIAVAPIGLHGLLAPGMACVVRTELLWVWVPAAMLGIASLAFRQRRG